MSDAKRPAWARPEAFDEVPFGHPPYGYVNRKRESVGFDSFDELARTVKDDPTQGIGFVWTPASPYLVTPEEVPELFPAVKRFRIEASRDNFLDAGRNAVLFGLFLVWALLAIWEGSIVALLRNPTFAFGLILLVMLGLMPLYQSWKDRRAARALTPQAMAEDAPAVRFDIWLARQPTMGAKRLLAAFLMVGVAQLYDVLVQKEMGVAPLTTDGVSRLTQVPGWFAAGALLKPLAGDWWRLATAMFIHGGLLHFFFNFMALHYLGRRVEVLVGWQHLMGSFLVTGLLGGICSLLFVSQPSVGASGAICGLLGFLIVFETLHRELVPRSARRRLLGAVIGLTLIGLIGLELIDNAAHAGGLFAGMGYAWVVFPKSSSPLRPHTGKLGTVWGMICLLLLAAAVLLTVIKVA